MKNQLIITTSLCALLGMPLVSLADSAQSVQQVQNAASNGEHPFFQNSLYPDWSKLTPEQARIDSAAAMVLARHRIAEISNIRPEEATFENTFLALALAQDELDKVQNRIYHLKTVADSEELRQVQEELMPQWNELGAEVKEGAWMLIEPCNRYETRYLTRLCDCREMLERARPENTRHMGLLADFFHMALEEKDLEACVVEHGSWIRHVHLGDHNRMPPGYGRTDWKSCMRGLKQVGFDGYMNMECGIPGPYDVILPEAAQFLRRIARDI